MATLKTSDFYYHLPPELIAQEPVEPRDHSRLLVLHESTGKIEHRFFYHLPEYLNKGDLLVLNDSRVIPARLLGYKEGTGAKAEILLLRSLGEGLWEALARPGRRLKKGSVVVIGEKTAGAGLKPAHATVSGEDGKNSELIRAPFDELRVNDNPFVVSLSNHKGKGIKGEGIHNNVILVEIMEERDEGIRLVKVRGEELIEKLGRVPLPPYVHRTLVDPERYQTLYSKAPGSVAAPTAGLHFTHDLLENLKAMGINLTYITLHVGLDSFRVVKEKEPEKHTLHKEYAVIDEGTVKVISEARKKGRRIICVGTTVVRALEQAALASSVLRAKRSNPSVHQAGKDEEQVASFSPYTKSLIETGLSLKPYSGWCDLFILPGYHFQLLDGLITNFHPPRSTQLMLISALAGREKVRATYEEAKNLGYRFLSLGDAMLII